MNLRAFFLVAGFIFFVSSVSGQETDSIAVLKKSNKTEKQAAKKRKKESAPEKPVPDENRYAKYNTMYELIRAELPELQVTGNTILVRGYTSVTGSSQPIFVVDGVIMTQIEDIMPNRVRSIRVLKGAPAAIYGINGANGVIEINTISRADAK